MREEAVRLAEIAQRNRLTYLAFLADPGDPLARISAGDPAESTILGGCIEPGERLWSQPRTVLTPVAL